MEYLKLSWLFFRIGAMNEMQYRINFFVQLFQSLLTLGTGLIVLVLVFSYAETLAGWRPAELLAVLGVHILMGGIIKTSIQPNMVRLLGEVRDGTLDYALTKPVDSQLIVSVREVRLWQIMDMIIGLIVLGTSVFRLQAVIGWDDALYFALMLALGAVMIYSFWLILATGAFWLVRMEQIVELFQSVYQAGRWPVSIYPGWPRGMLTFLVPIAFAVTVPAEALTGRLTVQVMVGTAVLAAVLFIFARWFWHVGLRNYSGASA